MSQLKQVDPAALSPGELIESVRHAAERYGVSLALIDGLDGYLNAMPGERHLVIQVHGLLMFLDQEEVATIPASARQGLIAGVPVLPAATDTGVVKPPSSDGRPPQKRA